MIFAALLLVAVPQERAGPVCDAVWRDEGRGREVPVRIRMPAGTAKAPVILFSHGLGGSTDAGTIWAKAWAEAGFIVIHIQHPGSDTPAVRANGFRASMGAEQLVARVGDVRFVIDRVAAHQRQDACDLGRADADHIGMSGHSFGAHTTQAVAGQRYGSYGAAFADPRIKAAIAFSPSPGQNSDSDAFGAIRIPFFSLTGSLDAVPQLTATTPEDRQRPFRAMPAGGKYLLVFDGANHAAFGGQHYAPRGPAPDDHVEPIVIRLTTLFWRWTLMGDASAKVALDKGDPDLGPQDRFEKK
ncbi:dienelactone hydrolase [Sphingomonas sp. LB-2]|uniref:alpha/beta hydrolase family protein n=1 Tax=Sphingomonas caeni TaxID=2984949 RepID=UPI00222F08E6|nr:dienelactone hydrolase [Sphingomonas caeni]MCW3845642.1 dienelactone hydrolase [Sphingomonas caeni]